MFVEQICFSTFVDCFVLFPEIYFHNRFFNALYSVMPVFHSNIQKVEK